MTAPPERRPRAVLLVANAAAPYSRALRVGRSLARFGYDVEIAAVGVGGHPVEERDGDVVIRRYRPRGRWAAWASDGTGPSTRISRWIMSCTRLTQRLRRRTGIPVPAPEHVLKAIAWPVGPRGWWRALEEDLAPADLYHAFGILTLDVANRLAARARRQGFAGRVIYDVIDVILESNNYDRLPGPLVSLYRWRERRWMRKADAVVTVNDPIADHLVQTWKLATRPTVLLNCQPRWTPPEVRPDLIRAATGIPPERRIVLWLGRLGKDRGLDQAAEAVLRLDDAALVMLGFGLWADQLRRRDGDPRFAGRHFTLPAVHPDEVPAWTASADVSIIAVSATSLNQRLSTPNKFWESLTAGTPIVLGRGLEVMRAMIEADDLGRTADPADPADLARALSEILDQGTEALAAMQARCLRLASTTYDWETAVVPYLSLVSALVPDRDEGEPQRRER